MVMTIALPLIVYLHSFHGQAAGVSSYVSAISTNPDWRCNWISELKGNEGMTFLLTVNCQSIIQNHIATLLSTAQRINFHIRFWLNHDVGAFSRSGIPWKGTRYRYVWEGLGPPPTSGKFSNKHKFRKWKYYLEGLTSVPPTDMSNNPSAESFERRTSWTLLYVWFGSGILLLYVCGVGEFINAIPRRHWL